MYDLLLQMTNMKSIDLVVCKCPATYLYKTLTKQILLLKNLIPIANSKRLDKAIAIYSWSCLLKS